MQNKNQFNYLIQMIIFCIAAETNRTDGS